MSSLKDGALDGLTPEEQTRKIAAHTVIAQAFDQARLGLVPDAPRFHSRAVTKIMTLSPTPFGTQTQVMNTPTGQQQEDKAERAAQAHEMNGIKDTLKAQRLVDAQKDFNRARQKSRIRRRDINQSRTR